MSVAPVVRLAALNSSDANEAIALRLPKEELGHHESPYELIEAAVSGLIEQVTEAICLNGQEVVLSIETAELIALALKTRTRAPHRPRHTQDEIVRREALVAYARSLKIEYRKSGMRAGDAELRAAEMAADLGARLGDVASLQTIRKLMRSRPKKPR